MVFLSCCGLLTLQVGTAVTATIFFMIGFLTIGINVFDYKEHPLNSWPVDLFLTCVFAILMLSAGVLIVFAAYNESRVQCFAAVGVIAVITVYWLVLTSLSFVHDPEHVSKVCVKHRCGSTFWLNNLNFRSKLEDTDASSNDDNSDAERTSTPEPDIYTDYPDVEPTETSDVSTEPPTDDLTDVPFTVTSSPNVPPKTTATPSTTVITAATTILTSGPTVTNASTSAPTVTTKATTGATVTNATTSAPTVTTKATTGATVTNATTSAPTVTTKATTGATVTNATTSAPTATTNAATGTTVTNATTSAPTVTTNATTRAIVTNATTSAPTVTSDTTISTIVTSNNTNSSNTTTPLINNPNRKKRLSVISMTIAMLNSEDYAYEEDEYDDVDEVKEFNKKETIGTSKSNDLVFGAPFAGAVIFSVVNFVFLILSMVIMWSYARELKRKTRALPPSYELQNMNP